MLVIAVIVVVVLPIAGMIVISLQNDAAARGVEDRLAALPLPPETVLVDSYSKAAKLVGNGNGMQYLGAILISSELPLADLTAFYAEQAQLMDDDPASEFPLAIQVEQSASSTLRDIRQVSDFLSQAQGAGSYVVYVWGDGPSPIHEEFDLRGR